MEGEYKVAHLSLLQTIEHIMTTARAPRIEIEDLPLLENLSEEELVESSAQGRRDPNRRLSFQSLETRQMIQASPLRALAVTGANSPAIVSNLSSAIVLLRRHAQQLTARRLACIGVGRRGR